MPGKMVIPLVVVVMMASNLAYAEVRKEYYNNRQLQMEENLKWGKRDGVTKFYYENGQLRAEKTLRKACRWGWKGIIMKAGS